MNILRQYLPPGCNAELKLMSEESSQEKENKSSVEVAIKKIVSPSNFWVRIIRGRECDEKFQKLQEEIQQYFSDPTFSKTRVCNPTEGQRCVVKRENRTWHRAVINKVYVSGQGFVIYCNLVDQVEYESVSARWVYETPPWVWDHPIQSACFGLHGIAPMRLRADYAEERMDLVESRNMLRWDSASCKYFESLCLKSYTLKADLIESDGKNMFWVKLFSPPDENGNCLCINEELVKQQYAAVKTVNKHELNSAGESEGSGCEGKYYSPMQYKVFRDKLNQLLKENVMDPYSLSDSSDDSDCVGFDNKCVRHEDEKRVDGDFRLKDAPHKLLGQSHDPRAKKELIGSGDFSMATIRKLSDGASKGLAGRVERIVDISAESKGPVLAPLAREIAAFENMVNSKGIAMRSVAMQTGMDTIYPTPELESGGSKDFSMQVNLEDESNSLHSRQGLVATESTNLSSCLELKGGLIEGDDLVTQSKETLSVTDFFSARTSSPMGVLENGIKERYTKGFELNVSDFYSKAPKLYPASIESLDDISSSGSHSSDEQFTHKPAVVESDKKDAPPLKSVFIPDNLHSGSVILIRGHKRPNPISLFCKAPFSPSIQSWLEMELCYKGPRLIQAHAWPSILARRDVVAIAPRLGGKTLAYAVPIAHMVMRQDSDSPSRQPNAIIVTPDWTDAQRLHGVFEALFAGHGDKHKVIAVYGGTSAETIQASQIAAGCSVLICTAPSLIRICKAKYANFNRMEYMVLDDVNVLVEEFTEEIKELMKMVMNTLMTASASLEPKVHPQLICMGSQWTEGVQSFMTRFMKHDPLLLISHPLEAAVYGKVQHRVMPCQPGQRVELLTELLYLWEESKKGGVAIFVDNPKDATELEDIIKSVGFSALKAHDEMCQWELDEVRRQFDDESSSPVLVTTDDVIAELDVYTMQMVIHYSFPSNQHRLGIRLSTMQTSFRNNLETEGAKYARSFFLMSTRDSSHAPDLMSFLQRLGQPVSKELMALAKLAVMTHENTKSSVPLCRMLKSFGHCRDEQICLYRHRLSPRDKPNSDPRYAEIPTSGHVKVQVTHIVDATHYFVRLLAVRSEAGGVKKYEETHAKIMMDLAMHFSGFGDNIVGLDSDPLPGVIYALKRSYNRVVVLQITRAGTLNKKDLEEWTAARKQAVNMNAFFCWTTPGGARKTCVRLVDTGSIQIVRCDDLLHVPEKFRIIPCQAVEVRVCGVCPIDKDTRWLAQANEFIHRNLFNKEIEGNIVASLDRTMWLHPAVVRSKLPLTNCTVTEFNVAQQLLMMYADKSVDQVQMIVDFASGSSAKRKPSARAEGGSPRFPAVPASRKSKSDVFSSSKALEHSSTVDIVACMSDKRPVPRIKKRGSTSSDNSTLTAPSLTNYYAKNNFSPPKATTAAAHRFTIVRQGSIEDNGTPVHLPRRLPPIIRPMPDPISDCQKVEKGLLPQDEGAVDDVTTGSSKTYLTHAIQPVMKENSEGRFTVKKASVSTIDHQPDPDHLDDTYHLLGPLCERFCEASPTENNRLKTLREIHMRSVGSYYDLTEKDLSGLGRVLKNAKTKQELRIILGALLSLSLDEVPVASFIDLAFVVNLACSIPNAEAAGDDKRMSVMELAFRLCQAVIDSFENNDRVDRNLLSVVQINEMILTIEKYVHLNESGDPPQSVEEACCVLQMLRSQRNNIKEEGNAMGKENAESRREIKSVVREDVLDYNRFKNIDTDTDTESFKRPFTPVACRFDEASDITTDTDTLDGAGSL